MKSLSTNQLLILGLVLVCALQLSPVNGRYLPTRGGKMDRLDKLRELLKELLETEIEKEEYQPDAPPRWHPESKLFYKREVQQEMPQLDYSNLQQPPANANQ